MKEKANLDQKEVSQTTATGDQPAAQVSINALGRASWEGFREFINAYARDTGNTPLTIEHGGENVPVLEIHPDGTCRLDGEEGEMTVPLNPADVRPLYSQLAQQFNLSLGQVQTASMGDAG